MRNIEDIHKEIEGLRRELEENRGTTTEVYTRIVGYYRSVRNWNKGKREEYDHRVTFLQPQFSEGGAAAMKEAATKKEEAPESQGELFGRAGGYLYFYRQTCPNCPPVKSFLDEIDMEGTAIDVDSPEGLESAGKWGVYAAPTVIFLGEEGEELFRSSRANEMAERLESLTTNDKVFQEA